MDISIKVANRELNPAVCNFFQYENQTVTLKFTLDSYKYGEVDLRNYKAYGVTSQNGLVDMTELVSTYDSAKDELTLTWEVQEYSLRQVGPITYQICFKENANDGENTAVFYSYKGIMINRGSIDGDNHITANYPTLLKQWLDRMNNMADLFDAGVVYMPYGQSLPVSDRLSGRLYFQYTDTANTTGHFEDEKGNILTDPNVVHLIGAEEIDGTKTFNSTTIMKNGIELVQDTPRIDFRFDNSTEDFTSRIIEDKKGVLSLGGSTPENATGKEIATADWVRSTSGGEPLFSFRWEDHLLDDLRY
ncbi:MAG: hypothetical protein IKB61_03125, partial [Elusimicrobiaceae bacterium]|nr:hypothetical protein [Elusimicrobiaceae bacterium]